MTDERSFMSVGMSGAVQGHPNPHSNPQVDQQDFAQGYSQQPDDDPYRRGSPSNVSFTGRSLYPPARPSSQAYGGPMSVQLPSLNGVFHDPTRSLYGPGTSALPPGPYGGPSPSDENLNTFRLPLGATVPSSHPPLQYDYQPHHQQDFHHDRHSAHSQASYRNHPHPPEHPSPSVTPNIPSNSSPGPSTYPQPRQHHPHQQLAPSMMYTPHPPEPSSSAFRRSFAPSGPQPYTNSHSSPSLSPQLEVITSAAPPSTSDPVKTEDRPAPGVTASSSRSTKRREKPKIELAPDQPLTTQGKPRARVYVACIQCRTRKIRCDGAKPVCHNCSRRQSMNSSSSARNADAGSSSGTSPTSPTTSDPLGPCCYDAAPKRRGPDKNPGSRQRISHAQRDLEIMGMNGTADGGKVKRRRRRDTNAVPTAIAAGTAGALLEPGTSSSLQDTSTIDKQLGSGISREPATRSNLASGAVSEVPTDGAAHSPVSMSVPSSSTSMSLGHVVGSGAVSGPISGSGSAAESIPPSSLHMPPGVAGADDFGQQMVTNSNGPGHMRSPDSYRNVPGQMRVPQGMSHQLGPHYSHTTDPRISAERTHSLQREGYTSLQPDGIHRVYTGHDGAYSTMSTRLQVQIPSQGGQQQPRPLRTDVPRLISPAQEYPHTHSHHQTLSYQPQNTTHTPAHISNALGYLTPPYDVPRPYQSMATISSVEEYENESESSGSRAVGTISERRPEIGAGPSVQFAREIWWDTLISLYYSRTQSQSSGVQLALNTNQPLSPGLRESLGQQVTADLKFLFRASNYWFSFVNVPRFFSRLLDPAQRPSLQPSLVLAALACANLTRSSEQEDGKDGRDWALTLLSLAQAALEASTNSGWIDETLVQASWMMTFFEVSAHPAHTGIRVQSALTMLDNLIASLSLSVLDRNDDRTCRFGSRTVPIVGTSSPVPAPDSPRHTAWSSPASALLTATSIDTAALHHPPGTQTQTSTTGLISASAPSCGCHALTLGQNSRYANDLTPLWLMTPAWSPDAPDPEIRKEECRRVVWSAVTLIAGYTSYVAALNAAPQLRLSLMDPSNIVLLFPAETLSPSLSANQTLMKSTIWALYMRTMILWHSCLRMRWDVHQSDASKAEFAVGAWLEIDRIEKALNSHTCGVERAFLFQGREYLFNTRMCISYEFQRFIPQATANANMIFHRKKAEEWLTHQAQVAKQTMFGLQSITHQPNVTFARRPFFVFWFMSQVSRALLLWSCDNSLTVALDVSKALLAPIEYLMSIWPCPEQQVRYHNLRVRLDHACLSAGVPLPTPYIANSSHLPQSLAS